MTERIPKETGGGTTGCMSGGCPVSCLLSLGFPVPSWGHQLSWVLVCYLAFSIYTCCFREESDGSAGLSPIMLALRLSFFSCLFVWNKTHDSSQLCGMSQWFLACGLLLSRFSVLPILSVCCLPVVYISGQCVAFFLTANDFFFLITIRLDKSNCGIKD